jgi:hypothetical protein
MAQDRRGGHITPAAPAGPLPDVSDRAAVGAGRNPFSETARPAAGEPDWSVWDGRHDGVARQRRLFEYSHLAGTPDGKTSGNDLKAISRMYAFMACDLLRALPDCPELTNALHRLWESKNLAVVARVQVGG